MGTKKKCCSTNILNAKKKLIQDFNINGEVKNNTYWEQKKMLFQKYCEWKKNIVARFFYKLASKKKYLLGTKKNMMFQKYYECKKKVVARI